MRRFSLLSFLMALLLSVAGCPTTSPDDDDDSTVSDDDDATGDDDDATGDDDDATGDDDDATGDDDDDATGDDDDATGDDDDSATGDDDDSASGDDDDSAVGDDDDSAVGDDDDSATGDDDDSATGDDDDATLGDDDDSAVGDDDDSATGDDDDSATGDDDDSATGDDDDATLGDDDDATGDDDDATGDDDDATFGDDDDSAIGDDDDSAVGDDDDSAVGDDDDSAVGDDDDSAGPVLQCEPLTIFTALTGTFDDGSGPGVDYDVNLVCGWLIDLDPNTIGNITLTFSEFDLESGWDFLTVYAGADSSAPVAGTYTGSTLPSALTVPGSQVYIEFESDITITAEGFELSWAGSAGCSGLTELFGPTGTFTDGSGVGDYANYSSCSWVIDGQGATSIDLTFSAFATEFSWDFVTVYDGPDASAPVLGSFSGTTLPPTLSSTGNYLYVEFDSDVSGTADGFAASWAANYVPCAGPQTLTAATGSFSDGSGPGVDYAANSSCSWLIDPPGAEAIALSFSSFSTEEDYDFVTIYNGSDATAPILVDLTGLQPTDIVIAAALGPIYVEFNSDSIINDEGFVATYTTAGITGDCDGNELLSDPFGFISDGAGDYDNYDFCSWNITVPEAAGILLDFGVLETEPGWDYVDVYDGEDAFAPLLGSYDGSPTLPVSLASTGSALYVTLDADVSNTAPGLTAIYEAVFVPCSGPQTFTSATGAFGDGGGLAASYSNSQSCTWLIDATGIGSAIELTAAYYDVEPNYDDIFVYDGADASAPLLTTLSGVGVQEVYTSTGPQLFVDWSSDTSVTYDGFWLEYIVLP